MDSNLFIGSSILIVGIIGMAVGTLWLCEALKL
jgi:hypothetical protein